MSRFVIVVLDGFGVGEMPDVSVNRPHDVGANTAVSLINHYPKESLPCLESLGLINITQSNSSVMKCNPFANVGRAMLEHEGGDTFMGHQEIMGTKPKSPLVKPFSESIHQIESALLKAKLCVKRIEQDGLELLFVNGCITIGDNLEADLGQVYNISGNLSEISFDDLLEIGCIVRRYNSVGRNIVFGGLLVSSDQLLNAVEVKDGKYIGVNAPRSGAYNNGFQVMHLGYGVDTSSQVPELIHQRGVKTTLIGKVADIVGNCHGVNHMQMVDTQSIMDKSLCEIENNKNGFFCINVQETDLSGHQENALRYWNTLKVADVGLSKIISILESDDILIVMADHGNDPLIGHGKHTREYVPLMIYKNGITGVELGIRKTMSDVGATVCDYFSADLPENGKSFLKYVS